VLQMCVHNLL